MIRLAFFLLIGGLLWLVARTFNRDEQSVQRRFSTSTKEKGHMIRCTYCEIYIPTQEAIQIGNAYFCCKQHHQLHEAEQSHKR